MLFSIAMTFSRLVGDGIVARFGNRFVLTIADRNRYVGDPNFVKVPVDKLLSKQYAEQRRRLMSEVGSPVRIQTGLRKDYLTPRKKILSDHELL